MHAHNFVLAFDSHTKCSNTFAIHFGSDYFPAYLLATSPVTGLRE